MIEMREDRLTGGWSSLVPMLKLMGWLSQTVLRLPQEGWLSQLKYWLLCLALILKSRGMR